MITALHIVIMTIIVALWIAYILSSWYRQDVEEAERERKRYFRYTFEGGIYLYRRKGRAARPGLR
ncbi:MAG: hypothetical protein AABX59_01120 [Nanoarchaeota archaeon]